MPADPPRAVLWTVGHGTRTTDALAALLQAAGVATVIDVRRSPQGRRQPQFASVRLQVDLPMRGIAYEWWGEALGGRRPPPPPSAMTTAWRTPGFAGYAAYMHEGTFRAALEQLEGRAASGEALAIMCAETLWWRCHRRLIADALVLDGLAVCHLIDRPPGVAHHVSAMTLAAGWP
jgi:uncharacterized protein (DUF488 family)